MVRIAILDLYDGQANQGMRCIREIINIWGEQHHIEVEWDEFDVRQKCEVPPSALSADRDTLNVAPKGFEPSLPP